MRELEGLVVLDEIQLQPELFPLLRVLADRPDKPASFLILGSAAPELVSETSETLAGRIAYHRLTGLDMSELKDGSWEALWLRGGFPDSYLAASNEASAEWRRQFISTFLQRDMPQFGINIASATLRRFWTMLAHYHGQTWNASEFARSFGKSAVTMRNYLDILTSTYVIRQIQPWHANVGKRQVKSPKIYLEDSGLMHTLLGLEKKVDVERHPKLGASWEGFAMRQVVARLGARDDEVYFWSTHGGAELDLFVKRGEQSRGFEFKRTDSPSTTKSMHVALRDLELDRLDVIHAGDRTFPLRESIRAVSLDRLWDDVEPLV